MKIRQFFLGLAVTLFITNSIAQTEIDKYIKNFKSKDWPTVREAKDNLENVQSKAIPKIMELLNDKSVQKLENTGSLIYPGATKFFGHGQIIDYDIDKIDVRAGWLLEDLTFQNFGFSGAHLPEKDLLISHIKLTFPDYYNNSANRKKLETKDIEELQNLIVDLSVKKAKEWWEESGDGWKRLDALEDALKSYDEKRQVKALFYIRNGKTKCYGLTKDYYLDHIAKEIARLSYSDIQRISEHASFILYDKQFLWLEMKK
jgi:hypothetical protein